MLPRLASKLDLSKRQQSGTFVFEHQKEKSAILRRKIVIPYTDVLGLQMDDRKIILDMYKRPQTFYKKRKMSLADATEFNNMVRIL